MKIPLAIEPNSPEAITKFARAVKITPEFAGFINHLRARFICNEHGYIKAPREGHPATVEAE